MYENIGSKIKGFAFGFFIFEAISSMLSGLGMMIADSGNFEALFWSGLALIFFGPLTALGLSWFLYGFGELIENSAKLHESVDYKLIPLLKQQIKQEKNEEKANTLPDRNVKADEMEEKNSANTNNTGAKTETLESIVAAKKSGELSEDAFNDKLNSLYWNGKITSKQYEEAKK
jgi:hypothetical protein